MANHENLEVVQRFLQEGDLTAIMEDAEFFDFNLSEPILGSQAISNYISKHYNHWFRDGGAEFINIVTSERCVVMEFTFRGIHQAEWQGIPATGKAVEIPMCVIYDLEKGKITQGRLYYNGASMLRQLSIQVQAGS